jgi:hypothetical protein
VFERTGADVETVRLLAPGRHLALSQKRELCAILMNARDSEKVSGYFSSDWCVQRRRASPEPSSRSRKRLSLRYVFDGEFLSIFSFPPSKFDSATSGSPATLGTVRIGSPMMFAVCESDGGFAMRALRPGTRRARS